MALRVYPGYGESFDSWIQRYAEDLGTTRKLLLEHLGVQDHQNLSIAMEDGNRRAVAESIEIDERVVTEMTLARYEARGIRTISVRRDRHGQTVDGNKTHTRVCPSCLRENGQWQIGWRLRWYFVCLKHNTLLLDTCPERQHAIAAAPPTRSEERQVWGCPTDLPLLGRTCGADLRLSQHEQLPTEHPILRAQALLLARIEGGESSQSLMTYLRDVEALIRAVAAENNLDRIAQVAAIPKTLLVGFSEGAGVRTVMPILNTVIDAALHTYAVRVLDDFDTSGASGLFIPVLDYARQFDNRTTPDRLEQHWGKVSAALMQHIQGRLSRTHLDHYRLRYYTALAPRPRPALDPRTLRTRVHSVPQLLWREFTSHFIARSHRLEPQFRYACATALLLPGWPGTQDEAAEHFMTRSSSANLSDLAAIDDFTRTDLLRGLCLLADYIDAHPAPIDYDRRRRLNYRGLLDVKAWQNSTFRNLVPRKPRLRANLQLWLWSRVTGSRPTEAPYWMISDTDTEEQVSRMTLPPALVEALDRRASDWLAAHGIIDEPITWAPTFTFDPTPDHVG
ncbi:TniQ protein [Curtobacterium sp. PhB138]|nr:TniQ protein [Curtobacterium sp. PhB171]ROQ22346.1 TniQ protein [Curtobacterium sp. PhB170]ROS33706.1 TniQ protein [Curtobacterium sp. PhB131]ROS65025.1 TniQ protein [Curtobacterium sp. PhB141]TCL90034.1 TniQ protein [Curtobacterium sp. PhB138]